MNTLHVTETNLTWSPGACESGDLPRSTDIQSFSEHHATSPFEELLGAMQPEILFLYSCIRVLCCGNICQGHKLGKAATPR